MDEKWKQEAYCVEHPPKWWADEDPRAIPICEACPVKAVCLEYCLTVVGKKTPGIWGGTTHAQRNPMSTPPGLTRGPGGQFLKRA